MTTDREEQEERRATVLNDAQERAIAQLRQQLAWRGPNGKWQNFVCLDREHALALVGEVEAEHDADADMFLNHALIKVHNELPDREGEELSFIDNWTLRDVRTLQRKVALFVQSVLCHLGLEQARPRGEKLGVEWFRKEP